MNLNNIKNKIVTGILYTVIGCLAGIAGIGIIATIYNLIFNL